jgi:hypothetical protein
VIRQRIGPSGMAQAFPVIRQRIGSSGMAQAFPVRETKRHGASVSGAS